MPELINNLSVFSLHEVTLSIQKALQQRYGSSFWIRAEMNKLNHYPHSGHCYPELVEKKNGKVVAQMKANLWKDDFQRINEKFLRILKEPIRDKINILFCAMVTFDPAYGLSLRIIDIDPVFSLGELEKEKQETLERLMKEGIFDRNKQRSLPLLPQRIAVISVESSNGYADYLKILGQNTWGYKFFNYLFPALLQGDRSVASILRQLRRIKKVTHHFDVVAIIRGGGGDVGLSSYNNYELAREIAMFPIPVITGIGHSTNETVAEIVAHKNAITPTELADFILQKFHDFSGPVQQAEEEIVRTAIRILNEENAKFTSLIRYFKSSTSHRLLVHRNEVMANSMLLQQRSGSIIQRQQHMLEWSLKNLHKYARQLLTQSAESNQEQIKTLNQHAVRLIRNQRDALIGIEKNIDLSNPENILKKGFTITTYRGKAIRSVMDIQAGETITTETADGRLVSKVEESIKK